MEHGPAKDRRWHTCAAKQPLSTRLRAWEGRQRPQAHLIGHQRCPNRAGGRENECALEPKWPTGPFAQRARACVGMAILGHTNRPYKMGRYLMQLTRRQRLPRTSAGGGAKPEERPRLADVAARTAETVTHAAVHVDAVPSAVDASRGGVSESCARRGLDPLNPPTIDPLPQD